MAITLKIFLFVAPTIFLLSIPQTPKQMRPLWAISFLVFSLLAIVLPRLKKTDLWLNFSENYMKGMAIALLVLVGCIFFPVGGMISQPLMVPHSEKNAEAIVVLASGATESGNPGLSGYQRVLHGVKLLKEGRAPFLYISTGFSRVNGHAEANWVASLTQLTEIPQEKIRILVNKRIVTTATEAQYIAEQLKIAKIQSILLVTSGSHIYRSMLVFQKQGLKVFAGPSHDSQSVKDSMGHYLGALNSVLHEWIGLLYYKLKNYY